MTGHIIDTVREDHNEIQACYGRIVSSADRQEQIRFQNLFTWALARNTVGKELVVYPAYEKHLSAGAATAEKRRKQNHTVKEHLKKFQTLDPTNPTFIPTVKGLMEVLSPQMREEENNDLVDLEQVLSDHDSISLSKSFNRTKIFMPSRAHPSAPSKPPFETVVGLLTAPIDQLGDLFRKWPHEKDVQT
ncbi:hypothetical protein BO86DRAFT_385783 [Aspergillus japonicus CBS 114.51]|uniref:Hemerythrin-like domain-containing protein n=2 Tax=Aspergillus TaxID=5052 RepID=A0A2V5HDB2_ASPV1|nr:hypothetical protein BO86DRAFT_385783 [Aspergillus japonicus CBS 114.51]PYI13910.1 hypothetical protein BO99DRAFT_39351 [Aspergillus violaceofuscus CBS 115571]RAH86321.1 hypothetical protein BO86DRAFT_385783 [Aspergillus japonicus CBS 114.51]